MGLGPPVCEKCRVLYEFKHSYGWECPICETNSSDHLNLWSMQSDHDTIESLMEELEGNERFLRFMKGPNK
jgi:hypothetical protein